MSRTEKDFLGDGYTTYNDDGSQSHTVKDVLGDGYTTYNADGSQSHTVKDVLGDGYTTYNADGSQSHTVKDILGDGYTTYNADGSQSHTVKDALFGGYTTYTSGGGGILSTIFGMLLMLVMKFIKHPAKWLFLPMTVAVTVILSLLSVVFFDFNSYEWSMQNGPFQNLARKLLDVPTALGVGFILLLSLVLALLIWGLTKNYREKHSGRIVLKYGGKTGCYILIGAAAFFTLFSLPVLFMSRKLMAGFFYANNFFWFWRQIFRRKEIVDAIIEFAQNGVIFFVLFESLLTILFAVLFLNIRKKLAALVAIITPVLCFVFYECAGFYRTPGFDFLESNIVGSLSANYRALPQEVTYLFGMIQLICSVMIGVTILCRKKAAYGITRFLLQLVCLTHLITMIFASKSNALGQNHLLKLLYNSVGAVHIDRYKFSNTQIYINASFVLFFVFALCTWVIDMMLAKECRVSNGELNATANESPVKVNQTRGSVREVKGESTGEGVKKKEVIPWIIAALIIVAGIVIAVIIINSGEEEPPSATEAVKETISEDIISQEMQGDTIPYESHTEVESDADENVPSDVALSTEEFSKYVSDNYTDAGVMPYLFRIEGESLGVISYMRDNDWNSAGVDIVSWDGGTVQKLYSGNELNYYAEYANGKIHILYDTQADYSLAPDMQESSKEYHVISLENNNISIEEIDKDSYFGRLGGAICLNNKSHLSSPDSVEADKSDYSYDLVEPLLELAKERGELVLDTMHIKSNGENVLYATLRSVEPDFLLEFMDNMLFSSFDVVFVNQGDAYIVSTESLLDEEDANSGFWNSISSFGCFDFDNDQHYYVEVYGTNEYSTKYLYGYSDGEQKRLLSGQDIYQTENGIFCNAWGESGITNVEVTFDNGEYKQYSSEAVTEGEMRSRFNNFDVINDANLDELYNMKEMYIEGWDMCTIEEILDAHLVDVRYGSNGKYFMTYEYTFWGGYSPENYYEIEQVLYYTYRVNEDELVKEEGSEYVNLDRKGNDSGLGLPYY